MRPSVCALLAITVAGCVTPVVGPAPSDSPCDTPAGRSPMVFGNATALRIDLDGVGWTQTPIRVCRTSWLKLEILPPSADVVAGSYFFSWLTSSPGWVGAYGEVGNSTSEYHRWDLPAGAIRPGEPKATPVPEGHFAWLTVATNVPGYRIMVREEGTSADRGVLDHTVALDAEAEGFAYGAPAPKTSVLPGEPARTSMNWDTNLTLARAARVYVRAWIASPAEGRGAASYEEQDAMGGGHSSWMDHFAYGPDQPRYEYAREGNLGGFPGDRLALSFHVQLSYAGDTKPEVGMASITVPYARTEAEAFAVDSARVSPPPRL